MNRRLVVAASFAVVLAGAVAATVLLPRGTTVSPAPATTEGGVSSQSSPSPEKPTASSPVTISSAEDAKTGAGLVFRRVEIDTDKEAPVACLVFSAALPENGIKWEDYVTFEGKTKVSFQVQGARTTPVATPSPAEKRRLCMNGLRFGQTYAATLRKGLPALQGTGLAEAVSVPISFGDRPPSVSFGSGLILPRGGAESVPITTVNIDRLQVKVLKVGERMLATMRQGSFDDRTFYPYDIDRIADNDGQLLWQDTLDLKGPRNEAIRSDIHVANVLKDRGNGVFLVTATPVHAGEDVSADEEDSDNDDGYSWRRGAGQWIILSDIGLTTFTGDDGMTVSVRSLATTKPMANVLITLIARNNEELTQVKTDSEGRARFDAGFLRGEGGMAPALALAKSETGDFVFTDLRNANFDLSDRGVEGRTPPGPVDGFLYPERGIYRPGETVHLSGLVRDAEAKALPKQAATLKITRPDGREVKQWRLEDVGGGALTQDFVVPLTAARGQWTASLYVDPKGPSIASVTFEVQDFVPQRLKVTVGEAPKLLRANDALSIPLEARFLYGAPAGGLDGEAELNVMADPAPFPAFKGFSWGVGSETYAGDRHDLEIATTDAEGKSSVTGSVGEIPPSSKPLIAEIILAVREPGGRATRDRTTVKLATKPLFIGVRNHADEVAEGSEAAFDVVTVDENGTAIAREALTWKITRQETTWQWYRVDGEWRYESQTREREIASGTLSTSTGPNPAVLKQSLDWGQYRLTLTDTATGAVTTSEVYAGWYGASAVERPDRLKVAADKPGYKAGETATLHLETDFDGEALLVVANERIHDLRNITLKKGGTDISVPIKAEWGAGAYALVTTYRPLKGTSSHAPIRSVGVAWLGLDPAVRTLKISFDAPEKIAPRQKIEVPVTVSAPGPIQSAYVTLAAVDEGILQLTKFKTPDPAGYFLGKRRLGVAMRDDYGRLIRSEEASAVGEGGDGFGGAGLDVVPTKSVSLFSGVVALDTNGKAVIPLEVPDFQGELRLMAVAFDATRVGSFSQPLTVRDPIVADVILPRYLAPGDKAQATVLIHNVEGKDGDYSVTLSGSETVATSGEETKKTLSLPQGKREVYSVPLAASQAGIGSVAMAVKGPGFTIERSWPIQVRAAQLPITKETTMAMKAGEETKLDATLLTDFLPGTTAAALSVSRWQGIDVPGLLRWLDRYPYGCLEQTVSRAMPLLYFNDVALLAGKQEDKGIDQRIQDAVDRVLTMQTLNGDFGLWSGDSSTAPWLSAYAMDFLLRAADKKFDVPEAALKSGLRWLRSMAAGRGRDERDAQAYAALLLARQGQANPADLRYFHDSALPEHPLALAQLGAALDAVGDRARATLAYKAAQKNMGAAFTRSDYYRTTLRDIYAVAATLAAAGRESLVPAVLEQAKALDRRAETTTTQEKAWMLIAAAEMSRNAGKLSFTIDGEVREAAHDPLHLDLKTEALQKGIALRNSSEGTLYQSVSVEGVPASPLPAMDTKLTLKKSYYTLDGVPVDLASIKSNDKLVVVIEGEDTSHLEGDHAILDLLPAGLEIEDVIHPDHKPSWLDTLSQPQTAQKRDDRFVAAFALPQEINVGDDESPSYETTWEFRFAYVVRAVTPGEFTLPAAVAEHMYAPKLRARTALGHVTVSE